MSVKVPIRTVFDGSTATGLAEYQSGEFIGLTHGGTGASFGINTDSAVIKNQDIFTHHYLLVVLDKF